jgi:acyl-CoA synthetase (AMP-forming)/AMP-acid ligase II
MVDVETQPVMAPASRLNVTDQLAKFARTLPDFPAVISPHRQGSDKKGRLRGTSGTLYDTISFADLEADVGRIADGLAAWGVPKGARLVLLVKPGIEFVTLVFALLRAGMVIVLVDPGLGRRNLIRCLSETEPDGFVAIGTAQAARVLLRNQFPRARWNVTLGHKWFWGGKTLSELRAMGDAVATKNTAKSSINTHADDASAIIFTSGSTGPPKGVLYTHRMFDTQVEEIQSSYRIEPGGVDLACFPLFALFNAAMGVTTVLAKMNFSRPASADPKKLLTAAKDWNVSQAFASPAVWRLLSNHCERTAQQIETLQQVFSCGAPVPADVLRATLACIGKDAKMHTPYGATECLPISTIDAAEVLGETTAQTAQGAGICVGRKFDSIDWRVIRITDEPIARIDEAVELPLGKIGELVVRGPQVSPRYVTSIEANAQSKIADQNTLWHRTGDIGYFDEQSRFWYCGRKSQRVETAAGPLFTECVEGVFNRHPDVEISALVGLGRAGEQLPVIAVKFRPAVRVGRYSGSGAYADFTRLAATVFPTPIICDWMEFEEMPVDVRHNSKINREILREGVSAAILAEPDLFHPEFVARARQAS